MRLEAILREARAGLASATARVAAVLGAALVLVLVTTGIDRLVTAQSVDRAFEFQARGGAVQVVSAPGGIDGSRCEGLSRLDGVSSAGALSHLDGRRASAAVLPDAPFALPRVTPAFVDVLGGRRPSAVGIVLSAELADATELVPGDALHLVVGGSTRPSPTVVAILDVPADVHRAGLGYSALDVAPSSGVFDECWVEVWPPDPNLRPMLFLSVSQGASSEAPVIEQLVPRLGDGTAIAGAYGERITRGAPALLLTGALALGFFSVRLRRTELSSARHAGVSAVDVLAVVLAETMVWASSVGLLAVACSTAVMASVDQLANGARAGLVDAAVLVLGVIVGATAGCLTVRERDFARYSRDR
ncbi:MAG: hypothetical protein J0H73_06820 [Salana multivorans]|uniref:hypothetical protein n=1 Tax=Salana multivorans TaxID=120377 RepID=UPI0009684FDB|nr:hypothetical protein [Salana multivorans]MBN8882011.1 hypothetical protein [Salana multivorans]OJX94701.1 MAG: hypothetical protein BGO96_01125 [Micrococcales bacterium 73-15]